MSRLYIILGSTFFSHHFSLFTYFRNSPSLLPHPPRCTALHCTTLHYTTLHYTTLHYTTLHYTTLHYTSPHLTSPHLTSPQHYPGYLSCLALSEGIECNRAITTLKLDKNKIGNSGDEDSEFFLRSFIMNYSIRVLHLQGQCYILVVFVFYFDINIVIVVWVIVRMEII